MAVINRAEWTKIRDRNGVKSGRAKVSIGKTLDAYHAARTCNDRIAKVKALLDAYSKYVNELDVKISGEQQLAREIGGIHIKAAKDALDKYEDLQKIIKNALDLSMATLLKSKRMMKIYVPYTKKEHNDENLDFIVAVDKKIKKQDIYEEYIHEKAPKQVNIKGPTRVKLDDLAKDDKFDQMNFADARKEIVALMERDSLPRFVQTKEFKELMNEMAGIDD